MARLRAVLRREIREDRRQDEAAAKVRDQSTWSAALPCPRGVWHGTITALKPGGLVARRHDGVDRMVTFSRRLEVITAVKQLPVAAGIKALTVGTQIGSVGLGLPDRSLRATRIWIYKP